MQNLELQLLIIFLGAIVWAVVMILVVKPDDSLPQLKDDLEAHERHRNDKL